MTRVISRVDSISASRLELRVDEGNGQDEIAQLARTFNRMLDRLEEAFRLQRAFVSNASHEMRTPLTAITGQIEVALLTEKAGRTAGHAAIGARRRAAAQPPLQRPAHPGQHQRG
jgi:signal transduction histidine kinase